MRVETSSELRIPETVQAVVRSRVDALPGPLQEVLRLASVVGREFSVDILTRLSKSKSSEAELEYLDKLGFVERMPLISRPRYRFRHIITQEVIYDALLMRERKTVHARVAELIEEFLSDEDRQQQREVEALAFHYRRADNAAKALDYFELAAGKAVARRALAEARYQLRCAIDESLKLEQASEIRGRRARLTLRWATACIFIPSASQIESLQTVMRESLEDGELRTAVLANYWINWIWYSVGNQAAAETGTRELLAEVEKGGNEKTAALLQCHLGQILMARRRLGEAESCLAEGLQRRTQLAMVDDQLDLRRIDGMYCYTTAQLALVYADIGSFARAHELMRHALDLVRRVGERATEASLLISAAILANYVGDWPGVKSVLEALHAVPDPGG